MTLVTILLAGAGVLVVCWLATCVRRVPPGQWLVVTSRDGVVRREHTSGLAWRLPAVQRFENDLAQPHDVPIGVRATTADGVPVLVVAEATVSIPKPEVGSRYADPWPAAEQAAEETIARTVTSWTAADIAQSASAAQLPLRREVRTAVDEHGVEVHGLALLEVDVTLDARGSG